MVFNHLKERQGSAALSFHDPYCVHTSRRSLTVLSHEGQGSRNSAGHRRLSCLPSQPPSHNLAVRLDTLLKINPFRLRWVPEDALKNLVDQVSPPNQHTPHGILSKPAEKLRAWKHLLIEKSLCCPGKKPSRQR